MKGPRIYLPDFLSWLRTLPCVICHNNIESQAAHIRYSDARIGKLNPGVGQKPHDYFALPLCQDCHSEQHGMNEQAFWKKYERDPLLLALSLFAVFKTTKDTQDAERIIYAGATNILAPG